MPRIAACNWSIAPSAVINLPGGDGVILAQALEALEIERAALELRLAPFELRARLLQRGGNRAIVDAREQISALDLLTFANRELDQLAVDLRPDDDAAL